MIAKGLESLGRALTSPISAASDLNESLNKVNVVFGDQADSIQAFAKTSVSSLGLSQQAALEATGTFGNLFTSMGLGRPAAAEMSKGVVTLSSDLASFNNIPVEEALLKIRAGLVGEAEPLRALGINLTEVGVKQEAFRLGLAKTDAQLTESVKIQARWSLIQQQSANAQGDFARTAEGTANASKIITAAWSDLSTEIGSRLLPVIEPLIVRISKDLPDAIKRAAPLFDAMGAVFADIVPKVVAFAESIGSLVGKLAAGDFSGAFDQIASGVRGAIDTALTTIDNFAGGFFTGGWNAIKSFAQGIIDGGSSLVTQAVEFVASIVDSYLLGHSDTEKGPLSRVSAGARGVIGTYAENLKAGIGPVESAVKAVADVVDGLNDGQFGKLAAGFEAVAGNLGAMKVSAKGVDAEIRNIDSALRGVDIQSGRIKFMADEITRAYDDQLRPLQKQLDLLKGVRNFATDRQRLEFELRDLAIRTQENNARGNKGAEEAARKAREKFNAERETFEIGQRTLDVNRKIAELPILEEMQAITDERDDALAPLKEEERILKRVHDELAAQKKDWNDLARTIADAIKAATPEKGAGGGGGLKIPDVAKRTGTTKPSEYAKDEFGIDAITGEITKIDKLDAGRIAGRKIAESMMTGFTTFMTDRGPGLIPPAIGAVLGGAVLGPIGIAAGALLGSKFAEGFDMKDALVKVSEGIEQVKIFFLALGSGATIASSARIAFGDIIPDDLAPKIAAVDAGFAQVKSSSKSLIDVLKEEGLAGAWRLAKEQMSDFEPTGLRIERLFGTIGTAASGFMAQLKESLRTTAEGLGIFGTAAGGAGINFGLFADYVNLNSLIIEKAFDTIGGVLQFSLDNWKATLGAMKALFSGNFGEAARIITTRWEEIKAGTVTTWNDISGFITEKVAVIVPIYKGMMDDINGRISKGWEAADKVWNKALSDAGKAVDGFATDLGKQFDQIVKDLFEKAKSMAGSIVDGLSGELSRRWGEITATLSRLAALLPEPVRKVLNIGSPSKVFQTIGEQIVDGIIRGVESGFSAIRATFTNLGSVIAHAGKAARDGINAIVGGYTVDAEIKGKATGLIRDLLASNNLETSMALGKIIGEVGLEFVDKLAAIGQDMPRAFDEIQKTLSDGLANATKTAFDEARDVIADANRSMADAIGSIIESRALRTLRSEFAAGQSAEARARSEARDLAALERQFAKDMAAAGDTTAPGRSIADQAKELADLQKSLAGELEGLHGTAERQDALARFAAAEAELKRKQALEEQDRLVQRDAERAAIRERFEDAKADLLERQKLAEEDRLFREQQERDRQRFEDRIEENALFATLERIQIEKDARLDAIADVAAAQQKLLRGEAAESFQKVIDDIKKQQDDATKAFYQGLPDAIRLRGGPNDKGFLDSVTGQFQTVIDGIKGLIQTNLDQALSSALTSTVIAGSPRRGITPVLDSGSILGPDGRPITQAQTVNQYILNLTGYELQKMTPDDLQRLFRNMELLSGGQAA